MNKVNLVDVTQEITSHKDVSDPDEENSSSQENEKIITLIHDNDNQDIRISGNSNKRKSCTTMTNKHINRRKLTNKEQKHTKLSDINYTESSPNNININPKNFAIQPQLHQTSSTNSPRKRTIIDRGPCSKYAGGTVYTSEPNRLQTQQDHKQNEMINSNIMINQNDTEDFTSAKEKNSRKECLINNLKNAVNNSNNTNNLDLDTLTYITKIINGEKLTLTEYVNLGTKFCK